MRHAMLIVAALLCLIGPAGAADPFDDVVQAVGGRFSGAVLVVKDGNIVFDRAYGMADAEHHLPNQTSTRFHVGTLSMLYTAAVVLRLVELHRINLDNTAGQFVPGLDPAQASASIQSLLAEAPGAPDATTGYTLLARIAAAAAGRPFADTADHTIFASVLLTGTGIDDGTRSSDRRLAKGYGADGSPAPVPDWADLIGAASAYTTTRGAYHWLEMLFGGEILTPESRALMPEGTLAKISFHGPHGSTEGYSAEGTVSGFSSYVLRFPGLTVVVLANVGTGDAGTIGQALAAVALNEPPAGP